MCVHIYSEACPKQLGVSETLPLLENSLILSGVKVNAKCSIINGNCLTEKWK
jgi:hypothetical protein